MEYHSPLKPWLNRTAPLQSFLELSNRKPDEELGGFLGIDYVVPVHEVNSLSRQSLLESWTKTDEYVKNALKIIRSDEPGWLDSEEVQWILEELGSPPPFCYPIYMITVGSGVKEKVVYFGKTSSKSNRFSSGHVVFAKLNAPRFDGMEKRVYQGCIVLLTKTDYLPLEWVHPYSAADKILKSIEAQLIYHFKPELNIQSKNNYNVETPFSLHIQNFTGQSNYLNDYILSPEDLPKHQKSLLKNSRKK